MSVTGNVTTGNTNVTATITQKDSVVSGNIVVSGASTFANITAGNIDITSNVSAGNLTVGNIASSHNRMSGVVNITNATASTDSSNGALVVQGGAGVAGNLNVFGGLSTSGNVRVFANVSIAPAGNGEGALAVNGDIVLTGQDPEVRVLQSNVSTVQVFDQTVTSLSMGGEATDIEIGATSGLGNTSIRNSLAIAGNLYVNNLVTADATLGGETGNVTIRNNLVVNNNSYVKGDQFVDGTANIIAVSAGNISVANLSVTSTTASRGITTGALIVQGGTAVVGNITTTGFRANIWSTTPQILPMTGALVVQGGASFGGNVYIGGDATIVGNVVIPTVVLASLNNTPIGNATPSTGVFTTLGTSLDRPNKRSVVLADFANSEKLDTRFEFDRDGSATTVNRYGYLTSVGSHQPRFTYDPITLLPKGILIEEGRTNGYKGSNAWGNVQLWTADALSSVTENSANTQSPGGAYAATFIQEDSSTGLHGIYQANVAHLPSVTLSTVYTASVFAKEGGRDQISIIFTGEGDAPVFDLSLGTVAYEPVGYPASIEAFGDGWYRCSATVTKTNTSGNVYVALSSSINTNYTGDGSSGAYLYQFQFEEGTFATSIIPTTETTTASRNNEYLYIDSTHFSRMYNTLNGSTIYVDATLNYRPTSKVAQNTRGTLLSFTDNTVNNRISILTETLNSPSITRGANLVVVNSGVVESNLIIATANLTGTGSKVSAYFDFNTTGVIGAVLDAGTPATDNSLTVPLSGLNKMYVGYGPGSNFLNGTISKIQYYADISTGTELQNMTLPKD